MRSCIFGIDSLEKSVLYWWSWSNGLSIYLNQLSDVCQGGLILSLQERQIGSILATVPREERRVARFLIRNWNQSEFKVSEVCLYHGSPSGKEDALVRKILGCSEVTSRILSQGLLHIGPRHLRALQVVDEQMEGVHIIDIRVQVR